MSNPNTNVEADAGNDEELDTLGLPRTVVDWSIAPAEIATLRTFTRWLRDSLTPLQLGSIDWRPEFFDDASELTGITEADPQAAQWIVRVVVSLAYWPAGNSRVEQQTLRRFVAPAFLE